MRGVRAFQGCGTAERNGGETALHCQPESSRRIEDPSGDKNKNLLLQATQKFHGCREREQRGEERSRGVHSGNYLKSQTNFSKGGHGGVPRVVENLYERIIEYLSRNRKNRTTLCGKGVMIGS